MSTLTRIVTHPKTRQLKLADTLDRFTTRPSGCALCIAGMADKVLILSGAHVNQLTAKMSALELVSARHLASTSIWRSQLTLTALPRTVQTQLLGRTMAAITADSRVSAVAGAAPPIQNPLRIGTSSEAYKTLYMPSRLTTSQGVSRARLALDTGPGLTDPFLLPPPSPARLWPPPNRCNLLRLFRPPHRRAPPQPSRSSRSPLRPPSTPVCPPPHSSSTSKPASAPRWSTPPS